LANNHPLMKNDNRVSNGWPMYIPGRSLIVSKNSRNVFIVVYPEKTKPARLSRFHCLPGMF
jgi:hypothetical protein